MENKSFKPAQVANMESSVLEISAIEKKIDVGSEVAVRSVQLFEPDFKVYADRGSNCLKWDEAED